MYSALWYQRRVHGFSMQFPLHLAFTSGAISDKKDFIQLWRTIPDDRERKFNIPSVRMNNSEAVRKILEAYNVTFVTKRSTEAQDNIYFSANAFGTDHLLIEVALQLGANQGHYCCCKTQNVLLVEALEQSITQLLAQ
eukprot:NODE_12085_length_524_cov_65.236908_g11797_i0.p1 GENE.NODE_12085_length_524_cov_65.236908_g11797_i0~~NODE_12085_length_524_cov_65.236908_g11797_i0.p1  ORF type:complete len:138 (-),score=32.68 NODE_12085_length_524_cov_65.236908_g11797_i0:110-523(-)